MTPYDLKPYHITLPVDHSGNLSGKAAEIPGAQLAAGYTDKFFHQDGKRFTFQCPDGGAVTDTAHYARCELRDEREWSMTDHTTDTVKFAVTKLGEGQKVVVHQIHDKSEPWVKIAYTHKASGGILRALVKIKDGGDDTALPLLSGLHLGDFITCTIESIPPNDVHGHHLKIKANGHKIDISMHRKGLTKAYYKKGCYYQSSDRKGLICEVVHS